jgi:hypothetical protein
MLGTLFPRDGPTMTKEVNLADVNQQLKRDYQWPEGVKPENHRFGVVAKDGVTKGVELCLKQQELPETRIVSQRAERIRSQMGDALGRTRASTGSLRQLGENHVFGKVEKTDPFGARKCIKGDYTPEQMAPDKDLGVSKRKLDPRTKIPDADVRVFGVPSIRYDKPAPKFRSVTSTQAYGNEENSQRLLFPSNYSYTGVDDEDFMKQRAPEDVRNVFSKIGASFSDDEFKRICDKAQKDYGSLSVDSFRHAWNRLKIEGENALNSTVSLHSTTSLKAGV